MAGALNYVDTNNGNDGYGLGTKSLLEGNIQNWLEKFQSPETIESASHIFDGSGPRTLGAGISPIGGDVNNQGWSNLSKMFGKVFNKDNFEYLIGKDGQPGAVGLGVDFMSRLGQYGLLRDELKFNKKQAQTNNNFANANYIAQAKNVNRQIHERQLANLSAVGNPALTGTSYQSIQPYMQQNQISEAPIAQV